MSKGILTLYVDNELKELAKAKLINMSSFFNECLKLEVDKKESQKKENKVKVLNNKIAMLSVELQGKTKEINKLKREVDKNSVYAQPSFFKDGK